MKPRTFPILPLIWSVFVILACDGGGTDPGRNQVASVSVATPSTTLDIGATVQLSAQARNTQGDLLSATVTWNTSDEAVASVSGNGLVEGVGEGVATITAAADGESGSVSMTVVDPTLPTEPSDVLATPLSNTSVQVTWNDNSDNEDEFRIDREVVESGVSGQSGGPARVYAQVGSVGPDVTSYLDEGLESGTSYRYRVQACNQNGCVDPSTGASVAKTFEKLVIDTSELPDGFLSTAYSVELMASGGSGDPTWSVLAGTLPPGIELSGAGMLSGTPTEAGSFSFTVQAQGGGQAVGRVLSLTVQAEPSITTTSLPSGAVGSPYSFHFQAVGGDGSYAWAVSDGSLPDGLTLEEDGSLSGTPTAAGLFFFTVEVASGGTVTSASLGMRIYTPLIITTDELPSGIVGEVYSGTFGAIGGDGTYTWGIQAGILPAGLGLDPATGTLSGVPTSAGVSSFTVQVTSGGVTTTKAVSVSVFQTLAIVTEVLEDGETGTQYSQSLLATGGDGVYTWSLASGNLPNGLSLEPGGTISGTPVGSGSWTPTLSVSSGDGQTQSQAFSLRVELPPLAVYCDGPMDGEDCALSMVPVPDFRNVLCVDASGADICPLPGQVHYGQDGNYSINPEVFTNHSSGDPRLEEAVSGLTWTTEARLADSFQDATDICEGLSAGGFGGATDWRVPTLRELAMILSRGSGARVWPDAMENPQNSVWWTSTRHESLTGLRKGVSGNWPWTYGIPVAGGAGSFQGARYVSCVSGPAMTGAWEVNAGGQTVTHTTTGLMWQRFESTSKTLTWDEALDYCEDLSSGGFSDWRLPTLREYVSVLELDGTFGFMSEAFGQESTDKMLTSTPNSVGLGDTFVAWVRESYGTLGHGEIDTLVGAARCVRNP